MTYTVKLNKHNNNLMYFKDGKLISKKNIPANELEKLEVAEGPKPKTRVCLFCGSPARYVRVVNLQIVDLCEKHYYDKNVGQIAQELNRKQ